ncbi:cellulase family glycosylhydrolase [Fulvivirgaceae bacterium BMA10]|uniref:Cellulase family glycosylhydrolase n=1 Tax=Splendidivirga corallicola TaxID=3051826 RepID=A0ABT8KQX1_9BACT|nr:cellulase family glycosylhydrolase [Fulvivirgaceae bacterium BMA10]
MEMLKANRYFEKLFSNIKILLFPGPQFTFMVIFLVLLFYSCNNKKSIETAEPSISYEPWSIEKANEWYANYSWLVGANFGPSTAINQLEMWQESTFDTETIDRELGWAADLGMNVMRVYLHHMLWDQDSKGFLQRMERYLEIADKHGIVTMFVLLDDVWDPDPKLGIQNEPTPHRHNSGWVQSPGREILSDTTRHESLKAYIKGTIAHFKDDKRILLWDLYNEPGNTNGSSYGEKEPENKNVLSTALMKKVFQWAREAGPVQPVSVGAWTGDWVAGSNMSAITKMAIEESDVITFHSYNDPPGFEERVLALKKYDKPLICTEYMARPTGSTFQAILPIAKEHKVAMINWGLVSGKTQTIYPWDSWWKEYNAEPPLWFHDIFHQDGTPYKSEEVDFIKEIIKSGK